MISARRIQHFANYFEKASIGDNHEEVLESENSRV